MAPRAISGTLRHQLPTRLHLRVDDNLALTTMDMESHSPPATNLPFAQDTPPRSDVDEILRRKRKAREYKVGLSFNVKRTKAKIGVEGVLSVSPAQSQVRSVCAVQDVYRYVGASFYFNATVALESDCQDSARSIHTQVQQNVLNKNSFCSIMANLCIP